MAGPEAERIYDSWPACAPSWSRQQEPGLRLVMVRGLKRKTLSAGVVAITLVLLVRLVPPLYARAKAVAVLADTAGITFPRLFAPAVQVDRTEVGGVAGDLYSPGRDAPTLLLVPGATREGRSDPRVVQVATALARANRRVFVPELHLYDRKIRKDDIERIGRATVGLAEDGPIGVVAFSYGGSFSLIAAHDPEVQASIEFVLCSAPTTTCSTWFRASPPVPLFSTERKGSSTRFRWREKSS